LRFCVSESFWRWLEFAGGLETLCCSVFVRTGMERDEAISVGSLHGAEDAAAVAEKVKQRRMMMMAAADGGEEDSPLYYPCACSGSIKYVHQECLLQWLNHSNARQCEVRFLCVCG
jgi:hypothetical protein